MLQAEWEKFMATDHILESIDPSGSLKGLRGGGILEGVLGDRFWGSKAWVQCRSRVPMCPRLAGEELS